MVEKELDIESVHQLRFKELKQELMTLDMARTQLPLPEEELAQLRASQQESVEEKVSIWKKGLLCMVKAAGLTDVGEPCV